MADITMCPGHSCPMRDHCYRYTATPSPFQQSYFAETPQVHQTNDQSRVLHYSCEEYWPDKSSAIKGKKK